MTPEAIVKKFVDVMNELDWEAVYALMSQDIVYHNVPFPVLEGVDAVRGFFSSVGTITDCDWRIDAIASQGDLVLTQRTDNFRLDNMPISLPVMGVFRIKDERVTEWRDYFDARTFENQLGRPLG